MSAREWRGERTLRSTCLVRRHAPAGRSTQEITPTILELLPRMNEGIRRTLVVRASAPRKQTARENGTRCGRYSTRRPVGPKGSAKNHPCHEQDERHQNRKHCRSDPIFLRQVSNHKQHPQSYRAKNGRPGWMEIEDRCEAHGSKADQGSDCSSHKHELVRDARIYGVRGLYPASHLRLMPTCDSHWPL
jgi:hypothetical protein